MRQLGVQQQQEVLDFLEQLPSRQPSTFDHSAWQAKVDAVHDQLLAQHGKDFRINVQGLLDEVRE